MPAADIHLLDDDSSSDEQDLPSPYVKRSDSPPVDGESEDWEVPLSKQTTLLAEAVAARPPGSAADACALESAAAAARPASRWKKVSRKSSFPVSGVQQTQSKPDATRTSKAPSPRKAPA